MIQPNSVGYKITLHMMHFIYFEHGLYKSKILQETIKLGYN